MKEKWELTKRYQGIDFHIKAKWMNRVTMVKEISERIGIIKLKIDENTKILIIQVYAQSGAGV